MSNLRDIAVYKYTDSVMQSRNTKLDEERLLVCRILESFYSYSIDSITSKTASQIEENIKIVDEKIFFCGLELRPVQGLQSLCVIERVKRLGIEKSFSHTVNNLVELGEAFVKYSNHL